MNRCKSSICLFVTCILYCSVKKQRRRPSVNQNVMRKCFDRGRIVDALGKPEGYSAELAHWHWPKQLILFLNSYKLFVLFSSFSNNKDIFFKFCSFKIKNRLFFNFVNLKAFSLIWSFLKIKNYIIKYTLSIKTSVKLT